MRRPIPLVLAIAILLSGCSNRPGAANDASSDPEVADGSSAVGLVTDDERRPLSGVDVVLLETDAHAVSDAEGLFTLPPVEPGSYRLAAELLGYQIAIQRIDVPSPDRIHVVLVPLMVAASPSPTTVILRGYIECSVGVGLAVTATTYSGNCMGGSAHKADFPWPAMENLRTVIGELVWTTSQGANSPELSLFLVQDLECQNVSCTSKATWNQENASVLRLRVDFPGAGTEARTFDWSVRAPAGHAVVPRVALVNAQGFTLYQTTLQNRELPPDYTALTE